jgi:hypothetical protein
MLSSPISKGETMRLSASCSEMLHLSPPPCYFQGVNFREMYKQDLPAGSEIAMTDSGFINDHFFLEMIQHFHKGRSQGKGPLSFDGHSSDASLKSTNYRRKNGIKMLCLPPDITHILQPLNRTVFKPIKTNSITRQ